MYTNRVNPRLRVRVNPNPRRLDKDDFARQRPEQLLVGAGAHQFKQRQRQRASVDWNLRGVDGYKLYIHTYVSFSLSIYTYV